MRLLDRAPLTALLTCASVCATGCDTPSTYVVFRNDYPTRAEKPTVVYDALWVASSLPVPLAPGFASDGVSAVPASDNTAYAVLAPGWDPASASPPPSLVAVQSRGGFAVELNATLRVSIDDTTFAGDCAAGSFLSQEEADFLTERVFPGDFVGFRYDATTCTASADPGWIARALLPSVAACLVFAASATAQEQAQTPSINDDATLSVMGLLARRGLHDAENERWNAYGQFTYITVFKVPFSAPYTNANGSTNSFNTGYERSFTSTFSLFLGAKLWPGGELYYEPDVIAERALSQLHGLGGATEDFELQKVGSVTPTFYRARLFLRQTFDLGGTEGHQDSKPLQLGGRQASRRLVLTFGDYGVIDVFDRNSVTGDPRQTFFNEAFMTHSSYDFPADARGFTVGPALELYWDDWVVRVGHFLPPKNPNEQSLDFRFWERFGDSLEVEHDHKIHGRPGAIRVLGYLNRVFSGRFDEAITALQGNPLKNAGDCPSASYNYGSKNFKAPDFCWVRRPNTKMGVGVNAEQFVAADIGVFLRAMISDGQSEVDAYDSADADLSFGAVAKGSAWRRPFDLAGVGFQMSWISRVHAKYLAMGGVDGFIGDGRLRQAPEGLLDVFYSANLLKAIWLAADYQLLWNPGYNADRAGPIHLPGAKIHAEF